jgi:hypothetical protein
MLRDHGRVPGPDEFYCRGCHAVLPVTSKPVYAASKNACRLCHIQQRAERKKREVMARDTERARTRRWYCEKKRASHVHGQFMDNCPAAGGTALVG